MEEMAQQAQTDGYVECSECGHALEQHVGGCAVDDCGCAPWTREQVARLRRRLGLPGKWRSGGVV